MKFSNSGYCLCCEQSTTFECDGPNFRDDYKCTICGCLPRERALMRVIDQMYPAWREAAIHESSPMIARGASARLMRDCPGYIGSQYFADVPPGEISQGWRCEDLEMLSFASGSLDLQITQDVLEHVFDPRRVFREIARTLRPGGMHIFTTPLVNKGRPTQIAARRTKDGTVVHLIPPEYHGNPASPEGSLVTYRWGYDIVESIDRSTGLPTRIVIQDMLDLGIRADLIEVLVTVTPFATESLADRGRMWLLDRRRHRPRASPRGRDC